MGCCNEIESANTMLYVTEIPSLIEDKCNFQKKETYKKPILAKLKSNQRYYINNERKEQSDVKYHILYLGGLYHVRTYTF